MKKIYLYLMIAYFFGCTEYGKIEDNKLSVNFPIKIELKDSTENWKFDYRSSGYENTYKLRISNINKLEIHNLTIDGNFLVELVSDGEIGYEKDGKYFFTAFKLISSKEYLDSISVLIRKQNVINFVYNCGKTSYIIDMENYIFYRFYDYGILDIRDIKAMYDRRLY